jgi:signal transduction histidine kinase/CheY-like chemotaxis protein
MGGAALIYNIDFEICALFIIIIVIVEHIKNYSNEIELHKRFRILLFSVLMLIISNIASAVAISYAQKTLIWTNAFLNGLNYVCVAFSGYQYTKYVNAIMNGGKYKHSFVSCYNTALIWVFIASSVVNLYYGFYFTFDHANGYLHGPLYRLQMYVSYYYVLCVAVMLLRRIRIMKIREIASVGSYVFLLVVCCTLQIYVMPKFYITGFATALTVMIMLFLLETPDYQKLLKTMDALEKSRKSEALANRSKTFFLANMSHEIRTPLNAIMGNVEMISNKAKDGEVLKYANDIERASKSLLTIIGNILDYTMLESSSEIDLVERPYKLSDMVDEILSAVNEYAEDNQTKMVIKVDPKLPNYLYGDKDKLVRCVINILNNAFKFTKHGIVSFTVTGINDKGKVELVISVKDTGIGIKEEDLKRLFSEFDRLDLRKNRNVQGVGLGLAISKLLISRMGGNIQVESVYGKGSEFTVRISQTKRTEVEIGQFLWEKERQLRQKEEAEIKNFVAEEAKILIVDDNKMNLIVAQRLLQMNHQVKVSLCESGQEMLDIIQTEKFDLVLLDHMMPEMDGVEAFHRMKDDTSHVNQKTPVVVLTANAVAGAREEYLKEGFSDYVSKPINPTILASVLEKFIPKEKIDKRSEGKSIQRRVK